MTEEQYAKELGSILKKLADQEHPTRQATSAPLSTLKKSLLSPEGF